jgi:D-glycero-D-manno-heptose 1,7-bisphosphate phosphatase
MKGAVFLDRDGTISEELGYVNHIDRFELFPWTAAAIRRLNQASIPVVLVTNQAGAAMGYFPETLLPEIHRKLEYELALANARLDAIYYCPHHPYATVPEYRHDCDCRKPAPGMLHRAARELDLDLKSSYMIGDQYRDIETAFRVEAQGVLVLSGYGKGEYLYHGSTWSRMPSHIAADLDAAVDWILQDFQQRQTGLRRQSN